jgi:hypothetical protein
VLERLLADPVVADARTNSLGLPGDGLVRSKALREHAAHSLAAATAAAIKVRRRAALRFGPRSRRPPGDCLVSNAPAPSPTLPRPQEAQEAAAKLEAAKGVPSRGEAKLEAKIDAAKAEAEAVQAQLGRPDDEESDPEDFTAVRKQRADAAAAADGKGGAGAGAGLAAFAGEEGPQEEDGKEVLAFEVSPDKVPTAAPGGARSIGPGTSARSAPRRSPPIARPPS